jgi:hypothetical protein
MSPIPKKLLIDKRATRLAALIEGTFLPDELLDTPQCADVLEVSIEFLEIARPKGYGPPFIKIDNNRFVRYRCDGLVEWLRSRAELYTANYPEPQGADCIT